jgi:hypothetical protein
MLPQAVLEVSIAFVGVLAISLAAVLLNSSEQMLEALL